MPSSHRCVFGCVTTDVTIHKFPHPHKNPEIFRTWVDIASEFLKDMPDEVIFKNRSVCDRHFTEDVKNRNNRLNRLATPTLHLPKMARAILENDRRDLPATSPSSALHLSDTMAMDTKTDEHEQSNVFSSTEISHTTDYNLLGAIHQDHSYCARPGQSRSSRITRNTYAKNQLQGLSGYADVSRDIKALRSQVSRLRKRNTNFKTRLASAIKLSGDRALQKVTAKMSTPAKLFTSIQFRETGKKPKGHRFTNDEKILALSLYKRSPKCYALLSKCFTLPSAKCLKALLGKIKILPGINTVIFEKLKHTVVNLSKDDCLCVLMFHEMSINPQLHYNAVQDEIKGFTTIGKHNIADHVLTFMVRGVKKNFKQPVAYYFTHCLNKTELKTCIKEVIQHVQSTGLEIIATVCDQSTVNVSAIESLVEDAKALHLRKGLEWRNDVIVLGGKKIIPIYDTPHLLKGIRNNLLTKDLCYIDTEDGKRKIVKWEYFRKLYDADKTYGELKILQKVTEDHINPQRLNKMRVKTAAQIFSHSVAVAAKHLVDSGKLEKDCLQITPFVLIMDKLFDSLNCNNFHPVNGKIYRAGVKVNSPHHKLWQEGIKFLKSLKFIEKVKNDNNLRLVEKVVPTIKNFIKTLEGMQAIWNLLNRKYSLDIMFCRNFNQDPIENFFGNIRSLGVRNVAPNSVNYEASFKALLLNNFCSSHSLRANCEDDMSTYLQSVDFFLKQKIDDRPELLIPTEEIIINEDLLKDDNRETNDPESYVCGWVLRKCCKRIIKGCTICNKYLMSSGNIISNAYIKANEYEINKKWLCYPSDKLKECFSEIQRSQQIY